MASPTRSAMQSATPNSTAAHMNASFACSMRPAFMIHPSPFQYIGQRLAANRSALKERIAATVRKKWMDMTTPIEVNILIQKWRRAVLDLVAGRKMRKQKGHG